MTRARRSFSGARCRAPSIHRPAAAFIPAAPTRCPCARRWSRRCGPRPPATRLPVTSIVAERRAHVKALVLASVLALAPLMGPVSVKAQDAPLEVNADAIKVNLERQVGKRVRLRLISGPDVEGTLVAVGTAGVHVGRLVGAEFFDAVVRLDQIAAVIVRVR